MKKLSTKKMNLVTLTDEQKFDGIVAFQLVEFAIDFFGNKIVAVLDTKILEDGRQLVIDGNGFIPAGYEVA